MADHGITFLGYQDYLREKLECAGVTATSIFRSGLYRDKNYLDYYDFSRLHPFLSRTALNMCGPSKMPDCIKIRSYEEYSRLKRVHATKPDCFRCPAVESAEIARWYKERWFHDDEKWMEQKRFPMQNTFDTKPKCRYL
ncbi:hypothetical protein HELRODRAFT_168784 [Helobdella robusta]|uniref:Uncharacterized protein n=1 Tax=Helobdella robusta TaxID=6412 RepID=T1F0Y8_HELRO|nr:hypothetical protein HELRODRAFT_168784 [Helobdella robusta]ESO08866.1 hypothetical protein HELRODRAFT_168784 [Helobdella robusta]